MLLLAEQHGGLQGLADATKTDAKYLSQVKNRWKGRGMGDDVARRIEEALKKQRGWMDRLQTGADSIESPKSHYNVTQDADSVGKVPVISWVNAGQWSTTVDNFHPGDADEWAKTTVPIRQHTYALRVRGDSMTNPAGDPTFPDGSVIVVEPEAIGDLARMVNQFVIVKRATDDEVTFKQLVKDAGRYYLKPLNPRYPILELLENDTFCGVVRERVVRFF